MSSTHNLEETKSQAFHSLALYGLLGGMPRFLKFPDVIDSALSGDKELLKRDLEELMIDCVVDIPNVLLMVLGNLGDHSKFKLVCEKNLKEALKLDSKIAIKNRCIDIINEILEKMHQPPVSKLLENYEGVKND